VHLSANDSYLSVDEILCTSESVVKGLRTSVLNTFATKLLHLKHQGLSGQLHSTDQTADKDLGHLQSTRTPLASREFQLWTIGRLRLLPSKKQPWTTSSDVVCRLGCGSVESNDHISSGCHNNDRVVARHNNIVRLLTSFIKADSIQLDQRITGTLLRPDITVIKDSRVFFVDVTIPHEKPENFESAHDTKLVKYGYLGGTVLPLLIGAYGAWWPKNEATQSALSISPRAWASFRRLARVQTISGTISVITAHMRDQSIGRIVPTAADRN